MAKEKKKLDEIQAKLAPSEDGKKIDITVISDQKITLVELYDILKELLLQVAGENEHKEASLQ